MKFREAVRHLEDLGLVVEIPNGKVRRGKKAARHPGSRRRVPVRVLRESALPVELREAIRRSRAESQHSHSKSRD